MIIYDTLGNKYLETSSRIELFDFLNKWIYGKLPLNKNYNKDITLNLTNLDLSEFSTKYYEIGYLNAIYEYTNMNNSNWSNVEFIGNVNCSLSGSKFTKCLIKTFSDVYNCNFYDCDLDVYNNFYNCTFNGSTNIFKNIENQYEIKNNYDFFDLIDNPPKKIIKNLLFKNIKWNINACKIHLPSCTFTYNNGTFKPYECNINNSKFNECDLSNFSFKGADIRNCDFDNQPFLPSNIFDHNIALIKSNNVSF